MKDLTKKSILKLKQSSTLVINEKCKELINQGKKVYQFGFGQSPFPVPKKIVDALKEKQEEMSEDVAKIKEAVYNPDQGLYARLRELESWKHTSSRMIWTLFTSVVGLIGAFILKSIGN